MPDITLCQNQTCPLRDNCKRALKYEGELAHYQFYSAHFFYDRGWDENDEIIHTCEWQLKLNNYGKFIYQLNKKQWKKM